MISVIIVAYNEEEWIHSIIDEIEKQIQFEYEILLADGGSTDRTITNRTRNRWGRVFKYIRYTQ